jgi:hypothetical protein
LGGLLSSRQRPGTIAAHSQRVNSRHRGKAAKGSRLHRRHRHHFDAFDDRGVSDGIRSHDFR